MGVPRVVAAAALVAAAKPTARSADAATAAACPWRERKNFRARVASILLPLSL